MAALLIRAMVTLLIRALLTVLVKAQPNVKPITCVARGGSVWWRVPVPLPLPIGAEGHVGRDTRLSGWGMVYIPL